MERKREKEIITELNYVDMHRSRLDRSVELHTNAFREDDVDSK